jgi:hypothetical protein
VGRANAALAQLGGAACSRQVAGAVTKMIETIDITAREAARPLFEQYLQDLDRARMAEQVRREEAKKAMKNGDREPPFPAERRARKAA